MSKLSHIGAALGVVAALGLTALATGIHTAGAHSDIVGHVYLNENTAGTNTVAAFARHASGALTPLPGSPFSVGGAGTGVPTGSQGAIQVTSDGHFLLAVDAGSSQISVERIQQDGSLRAAPGSPVASGGVEPLSVTVHDHLVYVANAGAAGANYTGFTLGDNGRLSALAGSTFALPSNAQPGDVLFNSTGTRLVGTRVGTSLIDSFAIGEDGRLSAAPGSPFPAQAAGPFGSVFAPANPSRLYVTNAHAGAGNGSVSVFHDARNGALTPIGASPFLNGQSGTCWVDITPDGRYLFAVNTGTSTISRYAVAADGSLTLLGNTPFKSGTGVGAFDIRVTPDGRSAYVVFAAANKVATFSVRGGTLTELASSPLTLPAGGAPFGVAVTAEG
jgi:6-phosphogluconolactonase